MTKVKLDKCQVNNTCTIQAIYSRPTVHYGIHTSPQLTSITFCSPRILWLTCVHLYFKSAAGPRGDPPPGKNRSKAHCNSVDIPALFVYGTMTCASTILRSNLMVTARTITCFPSKFHSPFLLCTFVSKSSCPITSHVSFMLQSIPEFFPYIRFADPTLITARRQLPCKCTDCYTIAPSW